MPDHANASAAPYVPTPPRPLTSDEARTLVQIADALIVEGPCGPAPSRAPGYRDWLDRALAARRDAFDEVLATAATLAAEAPGDLGPALRRLSDGQPEAFEALASVVAGAYLLVPEVREGSGYPGQAARTPRFDEAAEQIMDGILDPVVERGPIFRAPPPEPDALVIVDGQAAGRVLGATVPLSFWGGVDPASGEVIDRAHPLSGERVTGRILVLPSGRGSSSASTVLLELLAAGLGPAGIVLRRVDEVLATGAIVADRLFGVSIPLIAVPDATFDAALSAGHAEIRTGGRLLLDAVGAA